MITVHNYSNTCNFYRTVSSLYALVISFISVEKLCKHKTFILRIYCI